MVTTEVVTENKEVVMAAVEGKKSVGNNNMNFCISIILLVLVPVLSYGQIRIGLSTHQEYSTNPFEMYDNTETFISTVNGGIEYTKDQWNAGYYGAFNSFMQVPERNFFWQQVGLWYSNEVTQFGAYLENRKNRVDYTFYDYSYFSAYIKHNFDFSCCTWNLFGSANYTKYAELTNLNNWKFSSGVQIIKGFDTKTTIISAVYTNMKVYHNTELPVQKGFRFNTVNPYILHGILDLRVAQSITPSTGLALQYYNRTILSGTNEDVLLSDVIFDETLLYDDPLNSRGNSFGIELTQMLPLNTKFKVSYYYMTSAYPSQGVYLDSETYTNEDIRDDKEHIISASLQMPVEIFNSALDISLGYYYYKSASNSFYENFTNNSISLGLDFSY